MATPPADNPKLTPPAAAGSPTMSVLDSELAFDGKLSGEGHVMVLGQFKGVIAVAHVVVREVGRVDGTISGDVVDIRGEVVGDVTARAVNLFKGSNVEGDIRYQKLHLELGSSLNGRCEPTSAKAVTL